MNYYVSITQLRHCVAGLLSLLVLTGCEGALLEPIADHMCDGIDDDDDGRFDEDPPCNGCPAGTAIPDGWACIPAGVFTMGSPVREPGRDPNEGPQFEQRINHPFLASTTEVTQAEWRLHAEFLREVVADCDDCPARAMNWFEATRYANARSEAAGLPRCYGADRCYESSPQATICPGTRWLIQPHRCLGYRLPTEWEWEYLARAGSTTAYWFGDDPAELQLAAYYGERDEPQPVAGLRPNPWGLFDVHGNVMEWTWNGPWPYPLQQAVLWDAVPEDSFRVARGGSFLGDASGQRSAVRITSERANRWDRNIGLRLVRSLPLPE